MSELPKPLPPANGGTTPPAAANGAVAATPNPPAAVAATASQSAPLFGGHRGGGKKRADGLPAGSEAAKEADRKKDRDRKNLANAQKRMATLPPLLPGIVAPVQNANPPLAGDSTPLPGPVAPIPGAAAPLFVAWQTRLLEKPAKLITKIADRVRCWSLMKRIRQLGLTPEQEKEIAADLKWRDDVTSDFNAALAECAQIELNKRRVPGAQNGHWLNLAMSGGEMVLVHVQTLERLEKMVAANGGPKSELNNEGAKAQS